MDDLKIPVILLLAIVGGSAYYYTNVRKVPEAPVRSIHKTTRVVEEEPVDEEEKLQAKKGVTKKATEAFENGDFDKVKEILADYKEDKSYDIQRMLAYSLASDKEYDQAIVAFEEVLKLRRVPVDGYSLGYLYEITGRYKAAMSLYLELLDEKLPAALRRSVHEGVARCIQYLPEDSEPCKHVANLAKMWPESYDGIIGLIRILKEKKSYNSVAKISELGDKNFAKDYNYNFLIGELAADAGKTELSLKHFKRCLSIQPDVLTPNFNIYNLLKNTDVENALNALEEFLANDITYPEIYFEAALKANEIKNYRQAFRFYLSAVSSDRKLLGREENGLMSAVKDYFGQSDNQLNKDFLMAFDSFLNGDHNAASEELNRLKPELDNTVFKADVERLLKQCASLDNMDKRRDAQIKAYEDALKAEAAAKARKLELERKKKGIAGDSKKVKVAAIPDAKTLSDNDLRMRALKAPQDYVIQYQTAMEFMNRGNYKEAKVFLKNSISLNEKEIDPYLDLIKINVELEDMAGAEKTLSSVMQIAPEHYKVLTVASIVQFAKKDYLSARNSAKSALDANPNATEARMLLIRSHVLLKHRDEAREEIEKGLKVEKDNAVRAELLKMKRSL